MKGIALIRLQIGHLDSVCLLMRDDTVAPSLSPSPSVSLPGCGPSVPPSPGWVSTVLSSLMCLGDRIVSLLNLNVLILDLHFVRAEQRGSAHRRRALVLFQRQVASDGDMFYGNIDFTYIL